jgi:predicted PurR-regulated permease PerM
MAGVIRGQGSVILVLCVYYSMALSFTGLSFGLVIGLLTGMLSFIPFVGFLTGFTVSLAIATVQFWPNGWLVLSIVAVYGIGQFLEGNVLYPKLVGQSININPVWLMFALFTFAYLFGFVGLLLAVPLAAITAVLTRYAMGRYRQSTLYQGVDRSLRQPVPGVVARPTPEEAIFAAVEAEAEAEAAAAEPAAKPRARKARAAAPK